jgi:hypothetical protein
MRPRTETLPKALVPVAGRPFAERQVELLASHGVDDIVFAIAYLGHMIRDVLGDGSRWGVSIRYVDEGERRRGTGGATRLFIDSGLADDDFAVLYGDSYLPIDYRAVWDACGLRAPGADDLVRNHDRWDTSNASSTATGGSATARGWCRGRTELRRLWSFGCLRQCRVRAHTAWRRERPGRAVL